MITPLRSSLIRAVAGGVLALAGAGVFLFALPDAGRRRASSEKAAADAAAALRRQEVELEAFQAEAQRLRDDRAALERLMGTMPAESVGSLQWKLSRRLFELARRHGVRLTSVKYGAPAKEGSKGSHLEAVDVEFAVAGLFKDLKTFMLALEGSRLPFAVASAKLDESPEGAHLGVVLRAFRQAPGAAEEP